MRCQAKFDALLREKVRVAAVDSLQIPDVTVEWDNHPTADYLGFLATA